MQNQIFDSFETNGHIVSEINYLKYNKKYTTSKNELIEFLILT